MGTGVCWCVLAGYWHYRCGTDWAVGDGIAGIFAGCYHWLLSLAGCYHWLLSLVVIVGCDRWLLSCG